MAFSKKVKHQINAFDEIEWFRSFFKSSRNLPILFQERSQRAIININHVRDFTERRLIFWLLDETSPTKFQINWDKFISLAINHASGVSANTHRNTISRFSFRCPSLSSFATNNDNESIRFPFACKFHRNNDLSSSHKQLLELKIEII
jgi:hypothetical protein